jgi:hypothetical protein
MRDWSVPNPFRLPLEPDGIFQHAWSPVHWQADYSAASFPLDGLAQAADTLEQLGRSPALAGSQLSDLLQQRLAPEIREGKESTPAKELAQDGRPHNRQRPSELLRSMRQKNGQKEFKNDTPSLDRHLPTQEKFRSVKQENGALNLKSNMSPLERTLQPAYQPRTLATEQLQQLTGRASLAFSTQASWIPKSDQIVTNATHRNSQTNTPSHLAKRAGTSVAVPPASGAVQSLIQQKAFPGTSSSTHESTETSTGISSPFRFDDGRLSSSSDDLPKSNSSGAMDSPSKVNGARAFLSPLDLAKALQTQVQSGMLSEEQLERWAGKPSTGQAEKDFLNTKASLPLHETSRRASTTEDALAAALTNHLPARPPLVEVPPSGSQPHSPTPPPPAEVTESPSTGHVPGVSNTFNVTVHMGSGQESSDQELAERLTRILVDQARRYGIDV